MAWSYVIPDLHGRRDLLIEALEAIAARAGREPITLVALGDYVDKGPESRQVVEQLIRLEQNPPADWRIVCLKGNHDAMMVDAMREPAAWRPWISKGGDTALASYGDSGNGGDRVPTEHITWLDTRPLMHVDRHRVFVHAGVDPALPLHRQAEETLLWKRYADDYELGHGHRHVIHGHDSFRGGPILRTGRSNLDTRAWSTGRLVVGVFDDAVPGGPRDLITVQRPRFGE